MNFTAKEFEAFDKHTLLTPDNWFRALDVFEQALDAIPAEEATKDFFQLIFRGYDHHASIDLPDDAYQAYWEKIHRLIDRFIPYYPTAYIEKALQFFCARRGYQNKQKTLFYLQKGKEASDDQSCVLLGYYLYYGFCSEPDKIRGMELMNSALTEKGKMRAALYKGYIAINEGRTEEAEATLDRIEQENSVPDILRLAHEQRAFLYEMRGDYEAAAACYQRCIDDSPSSGNSIVRLAYMHYDQRLKESKSKREALAMMEEAFRLGRTEVAQGLYYCYFETGTEWQDNDKAIYWLRKGYEYADPYCTAEWAYTYLYNDAYKDVDKGLAYLDEAVELGYPGAMVTKAYHLFEGDLLEKDIPRSLEYLDRAIALGNGNAAYRAGLLYESGSVTENGEPDYVRALTYYEKGTELNDGAACGYAGRYYLLGLATAQDYEKAKARYEKGAELGNTYSIVELALMYMDGNGVETDEPKTFELLKLATEQDYAHAWYLLGRCYKYEIGTPENPDEAIACFEKAARHEHAKAEAELGLCYETGYGVEADNKKALEYMQHAADQGYPYAEYKIGCYYLYELEGAIQTDHAKAVEWLTKAVDNEYPYAMLEMGNYYLYDYDGLDERAKAFDYYRRAAEQDCVNEGLGLCYEYGFGVDVNEGEALKYYLKAAEDGVIRAKYSAGVCYYYGYGVKINHGEAYRWFNEAAAEEHSTAIYYKAKMLLAGEGVAQDISEGIRLLRLAADEDEREAQFELGNCYLVGKGVDENEDLAMEWFEKAAGNGHEQALKITGRRRK